MPDVTNVQVGACSVSYNGLDLGHTKGGVEVSYEPVHTDVMVDAFGETVVEKFLRGEKLTVKVPLAEYTLVNLRHSMPQAQFAGVANARMTIGAKAGKKAKEDSYQLVLHPLIEGTRRHDIILHKAYVASQITLAHTVDEQKIIEVTFEALLDETKSDGNYLGFIGDSAA